MEELLKGEMAEVPRRKVNAVIRAVKRGEGGGLDAKADKTVSIMGGGLVTGGGDLSASRTLGVAKANSAEVLAGTEDGKAVTPLALAPALAAKADMDALADVARSGDADDLTEGATNLLMTPAERAKLAGLVPQTSATDTTVNALLRLFANEGAFGLGATLNFPTLANIDAQTTPAGFNRTIHGTTTGTFPAALATNTNAVVVTLRFDGDSVFQVLMPIWLSTIYGRLLLNGAWQPWFELSKTDHTHAIADTTGLQPALDARTRVFATRAAFISALASLASLPDGTVVQAGPLQYARQASATAIADAPGWVPVAPYHLDHWGVTRYVNDGTTTGMTANNASKIQAAHDYVAFIGGGEIDAGVGVIPFGSTIYWGEGDGVLLKGYGRGIPLGSIQYFRASAATRLLWIGAAGGRGIVLTADRNDTGTKLRTSGGGIVDVMIDGNMTGGIGFEVVSHSEHKLRLMLCYWTEIHFRSRCLQNGTVSSPWSNQRFHWNIHTYDANTSAEPLAHVVIDGDGMGTVNTSIGYIEELMLNPEETAVGIHFGDCDGIDIGTMFVGTRVTASGDGGKVFFHSDDSLPASIGTAAACARYITVATSQVRSGIYAKATTSGTFAAGPIVISHHTRGNGAPEPIVEPGARLRFVSSFTGFNGPVATDSLTLSGGTPLTQYVEGTFTPNVADAASGGNQSPTAGAGVYTRIGRMVHVSIRFTNIDTTGLTSGNTLYIRGLPFPGGNANFGGQAIQAQSVTLPSTGLQAAVDISNPTTMRLSYNQTGANVAYLTVGALTSGAADLFLNGWYYV